MKILIGGDFAPTSFNFELFEKGDLNSLYTNEMVEYLNQFDYRVFDFETVFDGRGQKIQKCGPYMIAPESTLPGIKGIHPDLLILANNHINNLGKDGILHTEEILDREGIDHIGAGKDIEEARKVLFLERDGLKIGFYACAEHEYNAADENTAGVNAYDPLTVFDDIREAKKQCDQLIVFFHGGVIQYRYPLKGERRALRKMVDCGADLVVGQHTHCIGCQETYKGRNIVYGQGDFLFARPTRNEYRASGLLMEVDITKESLIVNYKVRIKPQDTIRMANAAEKKEVLDAFYARSRNLLSDEKMNGIYHEFMESKKRKYFGELMGKKGRSYIFRGLGKLFGNKYVDWEVNRKFRQDNWLSLDNDLTCESHKEIFTDLVNDKWNNLNG